jgi:hypothetical protein
MGSFAKFQNLSETDDEKYNAATNHNLKNSKSAPLQAWTGPEGSRRSRLPDF